MRAAIHIDPHGALVLQDEGAKTLSVSDEVEVSDLAFCEVRDVDRYSAWLSGQCPEPRATSRRP